MRLLFFLFVLLILGCRTDKQRDNVTEQEQEPETSCEFIKTDHQSNNTFPFNESDKVELVSYDNRIFTYQSDTLIKNGKFMIPDIKQRVTLDKPQIDSLFSILYYLTTPNKEYIGDGADCYNPRNSVVFYKGGQAIAFLEACFECHGTRRTIGIDFGDFCDEKWCTLQKFFESNKVDYQLSEEVCM